MGVNTVFIIVVWGLIIGGSKSESTKYRELFHRMPRLRLTTIPVKSLEHASPEDCARACVQEISFECKSFDVDFTTKTCRLQNHTHEEPFISLQVSTRADHYGTNYNRLFHRLPNHIITYGHLRKIPGLTVEQCSRRCILETSFKCMGFDYEVQLQNCWLTNKTLLHSMGAIQQSGSDFYEKISEGVMENFINFGNGRMQQIEGEHVYSKIMIGVTLQACAQLCLAETSFRCNSFDYNFDDKSCHMSQYMAANVYGLDFSTEEDKKVMHFEVKDDFLSQFYATPYTAVLGHNEKTYHKVTPSSCARRCLQERAFICRSFDYQTQEGTCLLSTKTGSDVGGLTRQGYGQVHHFEMKPYLDCGGFLSGDIGSFASPNWPRNYPHNMNCSWTITVSKFKIIKMTFSHFNLGSEYDDDSVNCLDHGDRVVVTEWIMLNKSTTCLKSTDSNYISTTNNLTFTFVSNSKDDAQGFRVFYTSDWPCGGTMTDNDGLVSSPGWPKAYPSSSACLWKLVAPKGAKIQINFISIDLEKHISGNCQTAYDYIHVYGGGNSSDLDQTFCGFSDGEEVVTTGNIVYISFRSDERVQTTGFHTIYKFILPEVTSMPTSTENVIEKTTADSVSKADFSSERNVSAEIYSSLKAIFLENKQEMPKSGNFLNHEFSSENETNNFRETTDDERADIVIVTQESPEIITMETDFRRALIILVAVFFVMFIIITVIMLLMCRYYRNRLPKRRNVPNFPFHEESVSLYDKDNAINVEVQKEQEETVSINFPQPSPSDPPADVSFINPMYTRSSNQQSSPSQHLIQENSTS